MNWAVCILTQMCEVSYFIKAVKDKYSQTASKTVYLIPDGRLTAG